MTNPQDKPALLDADARAFFVEHGWLVLRGVFSSERVAALEAEVDRLYAASRPPPPGEVWEVPGVSHASAVIHSHAHDATIAQVAGEALGSERIQLLQDTVLVKPARVGGPVAWHQDHTYTGYLAPARVASARLALTDCTRESGCLQVIDRSHAWGPIGDVRALSESRVDDILGAKAAEWSEQVVTLELAPGDVSLHHCLTLHRSGPNQSAFVRKTLITRFFDGACRLLPERLPPGASAYFPLDESGGLSATSFPLLWPVRGGAA